MKLLLEEQVFKTIAEKLKLDIKTLSRDKYFRNDLGLSSLRSMQLVCDIEDEFNVEIDEMDIIKLQTIGQLIDYIAAKK